MNLGAIMKIIVLGRLLASVVRREFSTFGVTLLQNPRSWYLRNERIPGISEAVREDVREMDQYFLFCKYMSHYFTGNEDDLSLLSYRDIRKAIDLPMF